jgi:DNA replication ATP-dependent helicase Dna2
MLLDGAENWDWNDMEADFLTPVKSNSAKTPLKVSFFLCGTYSSDSWKKTPITTLPSVKRTPLARRSVSLSTAAPRASESALDVAVMPVTPHIKQTCTRCVVDNIREDDSAVFEKVW